MYRNPGTLEFARGELRAVRRFDGRDLGATGTDHAIRTAERIAANGVENKIGADIPKYRILGACNPGFAHEALEIEDKLGVLLPCNVIVRETNDGRVEVASGDPVVAMERTGNPALAKTAEEVRLRLSKVIDAVG